MASVYTNSGNALLIGFMERLVRNRGQKIFLKLDNLPLHHSKPVTQWLAKHVDQIRVFYLPSYSPEHNPAELLNSDLKPRVKPMPYFGLNGERIVILPPT